MRHEPNGQKQSGVRRGGILGSDLTRRALLRSVAQGAGWLSLPGMAYCEVLPRLAALADRTAVIRSLHQPSSDHVVGSHNVLTGWYDQSNGGLSRYPDLASVISRMRSGVEDSGIAIGGSTDPRLARGMRGNTSSKVSSDRSTDLPRYIDIGLGLHRGGPAFLGPVDGPFRVAGDPAKPGFTIQNLESSLSTERLTARDEILAALDRLGGSDGSLLKTEDSFRAIDAFRQQAFELVTGGAAARAFDLSREPIAAVLWFISAKLPSVPAADSTSIPPPNASSTATRPTHCSAKIIASPTACRRSASKSVTGPRDKGFQPVISIRTCTI